MKYEIKQLSRQNCDTCPKNMSQQDWNVFLEILIKEQGREKSVLIKNNYIIILCCGLFPLSLIINKYSAISS